MRILLIIPTYSYKNVYPSFLSLTDFPTGFAYLASALRNARHDVFGLNLNNDFRYRSAHEMIYHNISCTIQKIKPDLIAVGGLCTDFTFLKDSMALIRKFAPDVPVVCGGGIINHDAEFIFSVLKPDFCVIGEGEEILVQLANMLARGDTNYAGIPNLGYWKNGNAVFTEKNFSYPDINTRCFPDYELFGIKEMLDHYSMTARYLYRYARANPRPMPMITARGCPFNCSFCVHQKGTYYRARSVENIIQEIAYSYERYQFNILLILDELFAVNKQRMNDFCLSLREARKKERWDFNWMFQTHASASLDREILTLAKEAGAYFFSYGIESASPQVLKSMNKKTKPSQISAAIELADTVGIGFGGNFIFGDVAEDNNTVSETMDFFERYCTNIHSYIVSLQPYPGSKLFEQSFERGLIRNKLKFYEHIDEGFWNMTTMPDRIWLPWIYLTVLLSNSFLWVKSTNAVRYVKEIVPSNSPEINDRMICKIWAICPHCNQEVYRCEFVGNVKKWSLGERFRAMINSIVGNARIRELIKILPKLIILFIFNFRHPLFKLIRPIVKNDRGYPFFVTGCPHCNKRIKIYIPVKSWKSRFDHILKKILFTYVLAFESKEE